MRAKYIYRGGGNLLRSGESWGVCITVFAATLVTRTVLFKTVAGIIANSNSTFICRTGL